MSDYKIVVTGALHQFCLEDKKYSSFVDAQLAGKKMVRNGSKGFTIMAVVSDNPDSNQNTMGINPASPKHIEV